LVQKIDYVIQRNVGGGFPSPTIGPAVLNSIPTHFFHEFPGATEGCLLTVVMELLLLPFTAEEIMSGLINILYRAESSVFASAEAIGIVAANLPSAFHEALYSHLKVLVKGIPRSHIAQVGAMNGTAKTSNADFISTLCVDCTSNPGILLDNTMNLLLVLMHNFFRNCGVTALTCFPTLIAALRPMESITQCYIACKLVAPFLHRIAPESLHEVLLELMQGLRDISPMMSSYMYQPYISNDSNPHVLLEVIVDFFYHCKSEYKLGLNTLVALNEIASALGGHASLLFTFFFDL